MLFNDAVNCRDYSIARLMDEWMSMEQFWNNSDRGKPKCLERNLLQCPYIPNWLACNWARPPAVGDQRLAAWATERPCTILNNIYDSKRKIIYGYPLLDISVRLFLIYQKQLLRYNEWWTEEWFCCMRRDGRFSHDLIGNTVPEFRLRRGKI